MTGKDKPKYIFCFFGFTRNFPSTYNMNFEIYKKYIRVPSLRYEDKKEKVTEEQLKNIFKGDTEINIFEYDKNKFIDRQRQLEIPRCNKYNQQYYRIFSFYNSVKEVLRMVDTDALSDNDIIILCRIDIDINSINYDRINHLLNKEYYDIIVERYAEPKGYPDLWFVFKKNSIGVFIDLYNSHYQYMYNYYKNLPYYYNLIGIPRSESIFYYHFDQYDKKVAMERVIHTKFQHVCNDFCPCKGKEVLE